MNWGSECKVGFKPTIEIEVGVADPQVERVIPAVLKVGETGEVGDGKMCSSTVEEVIRIRTEEAGGRAV